MNKKLIRKMLTAAGGPLFPWLLNTEWVDNWKFRTTPASRSRVLSGKGVETDKQYTERRKKETTKRTWRSDAADVAHGIGEGILALNPYTAIPYYGAKVGLDFLNGNVSWQTALNASVPLFHLAPQAVGLREATNVALEDAANAGSKTARNWRVAREIKLAIKNKPKYTRVPSKNLFRTQVYKGGEITDPYSNFVTTDPLYAFNYGKVTPYIFESKSVAKAKEPMMGSSDPVTMDMFVYNNTKHNPNATAIIGHDAVTGEFAPSKGVEILNMNPKNLYPVKTSNSLTSLKFFERKPSTIQISPEELYKVLKDQELNGYYFMGHGTGRTNVNPLIIFDNGLRIKNGDIGNTTSPISLSNLSLWPHANSKEIIILPGKAESVKFDSARGRIPSDWYDGKTFQWDDNPGFEGSGLFAVLKPNATFIETEINGVPGVYTKPSAILGSYNTDTHVLRLNPNSQYKFQFGKTSATPQTTAENAASEMPNIVRTVLDNGKIRLSLPSHTDSKPRQFVLEPAPTGDNKYYVHMRMWDDIENKVPASNVTNEEKQQLFDALYDELPEGAEILFPKSGPGNYGTRGTVVGLQRLSRDPRFTPGTKGTLQYLDKDGKTVRTYEGTSFIKTPKLQYLKQGGKINILEFLKNGGQIRKMQTAAGGPLQLTPEELKYLEWSKMTPKLKREYRTNRAKSHLLSGPNIINFWEAFQTYIGNRDPENPHLQTGDVPNPGMRNPKLIIQGALKVKQVAQKAKTIAERAAKISDRVFDRQYQRAISSGNSKRVLAVRDLHFKGKSGVEDNRTFVHSTKAKFNSFDKSHFGETDDGFNGKGFYFASTRIPEDLSIYKRTVIGPHGEIPTMNYGPNKIYSYLKGKREFDVGDPERNFFEEPNIVGILSKYFYDKNGPTEIIIGNPNNIKSAEAITYDNNGNIIPISLRDNFLINDIRYKKGGKMDVLEFLKNGSGIHIKEKNKGKFTSYCGGKVTDECIRKAKASGNPTLVKRATFALNARRWKHKKGGKAFVNGVSILDSNPSAYKEVKKRLKKHLEGGKTSTWLKIGNFLNSDTGKGVIGLGTQLFGAVSGAKKASDFSNNYDEATKSLVKAMTELQRAKNKKLAGIYASLYISLLLLQNPDNHYGELDLLQLTLKIADSLYDPLEIIDYLNLRYSEKLKLMLAILGSAGNSINWIDSIGGFTNSFLNKSSNNSNSLSTVTPKLTTNTWKPSTSLSTPSLGTGTQGSIPDFSYMLNPSYKI